jgi:hypothetical protein
MDNLFFCFNHQNKADSYIRALESRGWKKVSDPGEARFILSDSNVNHRRKTLDHYHAQGKKVFLYPHAARPNIFWDFPGQDFEGKIDAHFIAAAGHGEIMRSYGFPYPLEVAGWSLCPIRPFQAKPDIRRVVFAPIHPNSNGFLCTVDKRINKATFTILLRLADLCGFELLVRCIGELADNGIWKAGGVAYIQGRKDQSVGEIDAADLVVSHQTFAFLAVARGIPTLMMGESYAPRWGGSERELKTVRSWDVYKDLFRYPLDILEGDPVELVNRARESDESIRDWRERMIGEPFDPGAFVDRLEKYL